MKRILFVDDEPRVLDGLRRSLFSFKKEWQMEFSDSPQKAREIVQAGGFDVVVSDLRMPGMDGAEFLAGVSQTCPGALRVILSGLSEMQSAVRSAVVAHQFISKPCDPGALQDVLVRTIRLQEILADQELRGLVGRIQGLPTPPRTFQALNVAMADPEVDLDRIASIIERDVGLVAKLVQLVNSSFFGLPRRITSVRDAVTILGMDRIKSVVLGSEVFRQFDGVSLPPGFDPELESAHAQRTARIARGLLSDKTQGEFAFLAAMLHDVGLWVLASCLPRAFARLQEASSRVGMTPDEIDVGVSRLPHTRLGAYLLGIWGLPYPVVEAVAFHHGPGRAGAAATFDALGAVHVADCLANAATAGDSEERARHLGRLDSDYIRTTGVADRIDEWISDADELSAQSA